MKDTTELQRAALLVNEGLTDLLKSLSTKKPMSVHYVRSVLEDLLVHSGCVLFQLDCHENTAHLTAKDYHPGT